MKIFYRTYNYVSRPIKIKILQLSMRFFAILVVIILAPKGYAFDIGRSIRQWDHYNNRCRGGSGSAAEIQQDCVNRTKVSNELGNNGLCSGKYNLYQFDDWNARILVREKWIPCVYKSLVE